MKQLLLFVCLMPAAWAAPTPVDPAREACAAAIAQLQPLLHDAPESMRAELRLRLAELYVDEADFAHADAMATGSTGRDATEDAWLEKAVATYRTVLRDEPTWTRADETSFFLARTLSRLDRDDDALVELRRLLRGTPDSRFAPDAWLLVGETLFDRGDAPGALAAYARAASWKDFDKHSFAAYKLAWCQYNVGDVETAAQTMRAVAADPAWADEGMRDLVRFYADLDATERAWATFAPLGDRGLGLLADYGTALNTAGRSAEAADQWARVVAAAPTSPRVPDLLRRVAETRTGDDALAAWDRLAAVLAVDSPWSRANVTATDVRTAGLDAWRTGLRRAAVQWQTDGAKRGDRAMQARAQGAWDRVLAVAPDDLDAHYARAELEYATHRWLDAYADYETVVAGDPAGAHARFCAESAVFAAKQAGDDARFVAAVDTFAKLWPSDAKTPKMQYQAGYRLYQADRLDDAALRFRAVIAAVPGSADAEQAAQLLLDGYTLRKDWAGLAEAAEAFAADPRLGSASFRADVAGIAQNARFRQIEADHTRTGDDLTAARAALRYAATWPAGPNAELALHDAAIWFDGAGHVDDAVAARRTLVTGYPKSRFWVDDLGALAAGEEAVADFAAAASDAERFAVATSDPARKVDALRTAAVFRDALGDPARAVLDYEALLGTAPTAPVHLEVARLLGELGRKDEAVRHYRAVESGPATADERVWALAEHGRLLPAAERAALWKAAPATADSLGDAGRSALASIRRVALDDAYARLRAVRLDVAGTEVVRAAVVTKARTLQEVHADADAVLAVGSGPDGLRALTTLGDAYEDFADALDHAWVPPELSDAQVEIYRETLHDRAEEQRGHAVEVYREVLAQAYTLGTYDGFAPHALDRLVALAPSPGLGRGEVLPAVAFASSGSAEPGFARDP